MDIHRRLDQCVRAIDLLMACGFLEAVFGPLKEQAREAANRGDEKYLARLAKELAWCGQDLPVARSSELAGVLEMDVRAQATQIAGKVLARGNIASTSEFRKVEEYVDYLASAGGNADEINGLNALLADFVAKRSNSQQERRRPGNIPSPTGRKSRVRPCD